MDVVEFISQKYYSNAEAWIQWTWDDNPRAEPLKSLLLHAHIYNSFGLLPVHRIPNTHQERRSCADDRQDEPFASEI